jgi:hypothetical protein
MVWSQLELLPRLCAPPDLPPKFDYMNFLEVSVSDIRMGATLGKTWNEMKEVEEAGTTAATKPLAEKRGLRERLRTRVLRTDPRSASDGLARTPLARQGEADGADTPQKTLVEVGVFD